VIVAVVAATAGGVGGGTFPAKALPANIVADCASSHNNIYRRLYGRDWLCGVAAAAE